MIARALPLPLLLSVVSLAALVPVAQAERTPGSLRQLAGSNGCVADDGARPNDCTPVRALDGPSPFTGSDSVAVSGDGKNVYVAAAGSNAVTVLRRTSSNEGLTQLLGPSGCIGGPARAGCAPATALAKPTSVAVSADGRNVYAAAMDSDAVVTFSRDPATGALTQTGCTSNRPTPGCTNGIALRGADVVKVSPDGDNVYVGAFTGNAVAVFARDRNTGALTQTGCVAQSTSGCARARFVTGVEGLAVSPDGGTVYTAAALSNSIGVFVRHPLTGALTQAPPPNGCVTNRTVEGCTKASVLIGADAVAISPDSRSVYVAAGIDDGLAAFARDRQTGVLTQLDVTAGCIVAVLARGCALGRAFEDPEGVAVSPDGRSVYVGAFESGAVDTFDRNLQTGQITQKTEAAGCIVNRRLTTCKTGRSLLAANGIAVSPDGANVYVGAFGSDAVGVYRRLRSG